MRNQPKLTLYDPTNFEKWESAFTGILNNQDRVVQLARVFLDELRRMVPNLKDTEEEYRNDKYVRTSRKIAASCAKHNIARWNWIGKAGKKGKTFDQINARNSVYRQSIKRKTYHGNESSVGQDLAYDIEGGWIRKI